MDLALPSVFEIYASFEALILALNNYAAAEGYAVVKQCTEK